MTGSDERQTRMLSAQPGESHGLLPTSVCSILDTAEVGPSMAQSDSRDTEGGAEKATVRELHGQFHDIWKNLHTFKTRDKTQDAILKTGT